MTAKKLNILLPDELGPTYTSKEPISYKKDNSPFRIKVPNFDGSNVEYDDVEIKDYE